MTVPSHTTTAGVHDVATAANALRARGLRLSSARRVLLQALFTADGPVPAEALAAGLDGRLPPSDLTSVYRNLETLEQLGLVRHRHLGHGAGLYEPSGVPARDLVVCERCGRWEALAPAQLDPARAAILEATGFHPRFTHQPLAALCGDCADE
ncbi:MAG: transcriptional repressor [Solirubrobacteraceae bacterium]|nr:transcriptional repressor [Solirubrobacteraceae bacterium]